MDIWKVYKSINTDNPLYRVEYNGKTTKSLKSDVKVNNILFKRATFIGYKEELVSRIPKSQIKMYLSIKPDITIKELVDGITSNSWRGYWDL